MKGFRKMDEMEMSITVKAIRLSWLYSNLFLLVWIYYDFIKLGLFQYDIAIADILDCPTVFKVEAGQR